MRKMKTSSISRVDIIHITPIQELPDRGWITSLSNLTKWKKIERLTFSHHIFNDRRFIFRTFEGNQIPATSEGPACDLFSSLLSAWTWISKQHVKPEQLPKRDCKYRSHPEKEFFPPPLPARSPGPHSPGISSFLSQKKSVWNTNNGMPFFQNLA